MVEELPLNDLLIKYSKNLPLKVRVSKGFLGVSEETAINTGESHDTHTTWFLSISNHGNLSPQTTF